MRNVRAGALLRVPSKTRPVNDLARHQEQVENTEHEIESAKSDQREERGARVHHGAGAVRGAEQAVHQPRLTSQLGGEPARRVGNVWKWKREHENPEQRARVLEPPGE